MNDYKSAVNRTHLLYFTHTVVPVLN